MHGIFLVMLTFFQNSKTPCGFNQNYKFKQIYGAKIQRNFLINFKWFKYVDIEILSNNKVKELIRRKINTMSP
jgi:hypothetical protein